MKLKTLVLATAALFAANTMAADLDSTTQGQITFKASFVESICNVSVNDETTDIISGDTVSSAQVSLGAFDIINGNLNAANGKTAAKQVTLNFKSCPDAADGVQVAFSGTPLGTSTNLIAFDGTSVNAEVIGLFLATDSAGTKFITNSATAGNDVTISDGTDGGTKGAGTFDFYVGYQAVAEGAAAETNAVTTVTVNVLYK